jgi:type II secretory pathway component PulF
MIIFFSRWIKQWKEHFLLFWLMKLFCICLFQCNKIDPNNWSYSFVNVIVCDFFMNYNMKIFYKILAVFFIMAFFVLPKNNQFKNFASKPPHSTDHIRFKLDNYISIVKTSFHGLFVLFVTGIVGKFKKKIAFRPALFFLT